LFAVLLGSINNLPASIFDNPNRWFGVKVGDDPEMTPRQQIASAAYAVSARTVSDGAITAPKLASDAGSLERVSGGAMVSSDGKVGIGAIPRHARLEIRQPDFSLWGLTVCSDAATAGGKFYVRQLANNDYSIGIGTEGAGCLRIDPGSGSGATTIFEHGLVKVYGSLEVGGDLWVQHAKSAVVETRDYGKRLLYSTEGPESRFADEGVAKLENGSARVQIDPVFLQTIEGPYVVHVTPYGGAALYVAEIGKDYFIVKAREADTNVEFAWRLSGYRKGYAGIRLQKAE